MKKVLFALVLVALTIQGCSSNDGSLREDIKDVGQDIKNSVNKATD